jgi:hypothetical protein
MMARQASVLFTNSGTWIAPDGVTKVILWGRGGTGGGGGRSEERRVGKEC